MNFFRNLHKKNDKGQFLNRVVLDELQGNNPSGQRTRKIGAKSLTGTVILNKVRQALTKSIRSMIRDTKL